MKQYPIAPIRAGQVASIGDKSFGRYLAKELLLDDDVREIEDSYKEAGRCAHRSDG